MKIVYKKCDNCNGNGYLPHSFFESNYPFPNVNPKDITAPCITSYLGNICPVCHGLGKEEVYTIQEL